MATAQAPALVAVLLVAGHASLASATTYTVGGVRSWMTGVHYAGPATRRSLSEPNCVSKALIIVLCVVLPSFCCSLHLHPIIQ
jgi:hypothetical protein